MEITETAEVKLVKAEAELTEQKKKIDELTEKLSKVGNTEHFQGLIKERDEAKKKLKEYEDKVLEEQGNYKDLVEKQKTELETERLEKERLTDELKKSNAELDEKRVAEANERKALLEKITDEKKKKIAEALPMNLLKDYVNEQALHNPLGPDRGGNPIPPVEYKLTPFEEAEAKRRGLSNEDYADILKKAKELKDSKNRRI